MAMMAAASMTQDSGFHMNPRNLSSLLSCRMIQQISGNIREIYRGSIPNKIDAFLIDRSVRTLDSGPDLLLLELVGAEDLEPAGAIGGGEPVRRGLEDGEHLLDRDALLLQI
jgi:hypothetical protein